MDPKRWQHIDRTTGHNPAQDQTTDERIGFGDVNRRLCDHPDCPEAGAFPAPKSRQALNERYWFCLPHVQDYNRNWNYYADMGPAEVEQSVRADLTWGRATRPFAAASDRGKTKQDEDELLSQLHAFSGSPYSRSRPEPEAIRLTPEQRTALELFSLKAPVAAEDVKKRYKALAKRLHPDLNGGDHSSEDRLKKINAAYQVIRDGVF